MTCVLCINRPPVSQSMDVSGIGSHGDSYRRGSSMTMYTVNDIIRQLEIATNENDKLKRTIVENNEFFERRCAELQDSASECVCVCVCVCVYLSELEPIAHAYIIKCETIGRSPCVCVSLTWWLVDVGRNSVHNYKCT